MLVSIVIPDYNGERFIASTIESVIAQTFTDWELIVVDDGSTDGCHAIAQRYAAVDPRIRALTKPNGGVSEARNFGYAQIDQTSTYVIFLDHDDLWHPTALEHLVIRLDAAPNAIGVHGLARVVDGDGKPTGAIPGNERRKVVGSKLATCARQEDTTFASLIVDCYIATPGTALLRRDAVDKVLETNGWVFEPGVSYGEDWRLWVQLSASGPFAFLDEVVLDYCKHDAGATSNAQAVVTGEIAMRRKFVELAGLTDDQRGMATSRFRRHCASIVRRNVKQLQREVTQSLAAGKLEIAGQKARGCVASYLTYASMRLTENVDRDAAAAQKASQPV